MYLLLSGEGAGDIGVCNPSAESCDRTNFKQGPMAMIVDQLVSTFQGYEMSHLDTDRVSFVSEAYLKTNKLAPKAKAMALRGKKKPAETKYFYENARALAAAAKAKSAELNDKVVAILFRDSDGTSSAGRGNWEDKRNSMIEGFLAEAFELGVAMVPKPKSEAWLLCATKVNPYQHCIALEDESGNDRSGNSLKHQLSVSLRGNSETRELNILISNMTIDVNKIEMPSFDAFKKDLRLAVTRANSVEL
ncbi:MAG: hypothetical protein KJ556_19930 [Gammaproteobacteria bacterium]|nr:hypothetical protein [Gammaproteobacteria bacterium]MBU2058664.1 hypothetical protein [Gammaproteobacteria bacterium]MBU2177370.1 hypothetical protein [Gammaproteobacteria bacterium]MBU2246078.1 hypothetical protein [Gammaproteobacteria bacterium]MBU2394300.1 hypothetical protein [Gammaproteobacteria bacterium]